jgi:hypothetical protein
VAATGCLSQQVSRLAARLRLEQRLHWLVTTWNANVPQRQQPLAQGSTGTWVSCRAGGQHGHIIITKASPLCIWTGGATPCQAAAWLASGRPPLQCVLLAHRARSQSRMPGSQMPDHQCYALPSLRPPQAGRDGRPVAAAAAAAGSQRGAPRRRPQAAGKARVETFALSRGSAHMKVTRTSYACCGRRPRQHPELPHLGAPGVLDLNPSTTPLDICSRPSCPLSTPPTARGSSRWARAPPPHLSAWPTPHIPYRQGKKRHDLFPTHQKRCSRASRRLKCQQPSPPPLRPLRPHRGHI